jgi:hypothetical protein
MQRKSHDAPPLERLENDYRLVRFDHSDMLGKAAGAKGETGVSRNPSTYADDSVACRSARSFYTQKV